MTDLYGAFEFGAAAINPRNPVAVQTTNHLYGHHSMKFVIFNDDQLQLFRFEQKKTEIVNLSAEGRKTDGQVGQFLKKLGSWCSCWCRGLKDNIL